MKGICPVKTSPDWVNSTSILGEDNTWKIWMSSKEGTLPEPVKAAFYLYAGSDNAADAAELMDKHIPAQLKAKFKYDTTILEMIDGARDEMFQEPAYKQWLANNGYLDKLFEGETIKRSAEEVEKVAKKEQTLVELANEVLDSAAFTGPIDPIALHNKAQSNAIIYDYVRRFKYQYIPITSQEAITLLTGTQTPYNGDAVFHHNGINYFVTNKITTGTSLHEILLPVIQNIRTTNKVQYAAIIESIYKTPLGQKLIDTIKRANPGLSENSNVFKDKLVLAVLKKDSENKVTLLSADPSTTSFNKVVHDIMSLVRPSLRVTFAIPTKISLVKLDPAGSIVTNARILMQEHVDADELSPKDLVEANSEMQKAVDEILGAIKDDTTKQEFDKVIDNFVDVLTTQIAETKAKGFREIKKELADDAGGFLRDMADRLKYFRKNISPEKARLLEKLDMSFKAKALVSSLFTLEKTLKKIDEYMENLKSSNEDITKKLEKVANYNHLLEEWSRFINNTQDSLSKPGE